MSGNTSLTKVAFNDAGTFAKALSQSDVQCAQTTPGPLNFELSILRTTGLELHLTSMPVGSCIALGKAADNTRSFHVPLGRTSRLTLMGRRVESALYAAYTHGGELAVCAGSGARLAYIVPSPDTLSAAGYIYLGDELKDVSAQTTVTVANPARMGELQRFLDEIWGLTAHSPEAFAKKAVVRNLEQALVERLIAATALKEKSRATCDRIQVSRRSIIRKVDDYLRLLSSEPVYVSELCRAAGVSQPTLFRAFFDILGMGPKQYLQIRRLHLSRNRLLHDPEPGLTVHSVAYDLGFWHLGRFGTAYRELFGETPSQTLRRSHRMGFAR